MIDADKERFARLMAGVAIVFGSGDLPKDKVRLYFDFLKDLSIEEVDAAIRRLIATRKFPTFPTVAEIREAAIGGQDDIEAAALAAWGEANRRVGRGQNWDSGDAILDAAILMAFGGWKGFGDTDPDHGMADRAHFLKCYRAVAVKSGEKPKALAGRDEIKRIGAGQ